MTEQKETQKTENEMTRRNFLKLGANTLGALAALEIVGASLNFLAPRTIAGEFGGIFEAGEIDSFPLGSVTEFPAGRFFLIHAEDGGFLAIYRKCTHLGCSVSWHADQNLFICPCHASQFDFYGSVENPPAPRALDTFPISFADGMVLVDTGMVQQRDDFAAGQMVYA